MVNKNKKGFTLIELLVVISIISMMSSIVMASVNSARDKGRIAAGQKFSTHTYRSFGADALGYWNFDEAGTVAPMDYSGNNLNFPIGQTITRTQNVPTKTGYAADFSTAISPLMVSVSPAVSISTGFSYGAWIYPDNVSNTVSEQIIYLQGYGGAGHVSQIFTSATTNLVTCRMNNSSSFVVTSLKPIPFNKWSYALCSYDGSKFQLYIDGKLVDTLQSVPAPTNPVNYIGIGNGAQSGYTGKFVGLIDNVAIYSKPLAQNEVEQIYAEGLEKRQLAKND